MNNSFPIFERSKNIFTPTKENVLFLLALTVVFLSSKYPHTYLKIASGLLIIIWAFYRITASVRHKPLNGKYTGTLTFNETNLSINDRKIEVSEIRKIHLGATDYEGRETSSKYTSPMSNGTNNLLDLTLTSGEVIKLFFKIEFMQHEFLKPCVISLVKNSLITFEEALEILKMNDDDINQFKRELNKKEPE